MTSPPAWSAEPAQPAALVVVRDDQVPWPERFTDDFGNAWVRVPGTPLWRFAGPYPAPREF